MGTDAEQVPVSAEKQFAIEHRRRCARRFTEFVRGDDFKFRTGFDHGHDPVIREKVGQAVR